MALGRVGREVSVPRGIEDFDAIAPLSLRHVQRDVGTARHLVEQHVAGFVAREPEAQRDRHILIIDAHALIAQRATQNAFVAASVEAVKGRGVPRWLELDAANLSGKVLALPARDDVSFPIQEQLIVELYSK